MSCRVGTRSVALALLIAFFFVSTRAQNNGGRPQNIPFNTSGSHGPDGPWNYITLNIGSSPQSLVDFYPMTVSRASLLVNSDACSNGQRCISPLPGYFDSRAESQSDADLNTTTSAFSVFDNELYTSVDNLQGEGYATVDTVNQPFTAENVTFALTSNVSSSYSNKRWVGLSLLSLEAFSNNISQLHNGRPMPNQKTLLQRYNESNGGSLSMGLHMGSAFYNQSGSLYFGGFDQNRLIESPAVFNHLGRVNISGISYGYSAGQDPWAKATVRPVSNFISAVSSLNGHMSVDIKPQFATMHFPTDLCNILAGSLPMKYDTDTNMYLWNTDEPLYNALMTSPSYMSFTFESNPPVSIKVPFALLSLNLTAPIKDTPTPYFPCTPSSEFALGRAFLQSAIHIQSYAPEYSIIGQAPGPSVNGSSSPNVQTMSNDNPSAAVRPAPNAPRWNDTWAAHLKPLSSAPAYTATSTPAAGSIESNASASNSLSGGAIAGIVIGVIAAVAVGAAAAFFFLRRRGQQQQQQQQASAVEAPIQPPVYAKEGIPKTSAAQGFEASQAPPVYEVGEGRQLSEAPAGQFVQELPDTSLRAEIDGNGWSRR